MFLSPPSRVLAAAVAFCLSAWAGAQTAPAASAASAGNAQAGPRWSCDSYWFELVDAPAAPEGMPIPVQGVVVRVALDYEDVNAKPTVAVTFNSGDQAFADAVVRKAKTYRFLNCVPRDGSPLRFEQEVQFVGGAAPTVVAGRVRSVAKPADESNACLRDADGQPRPTWTSYLVRQATGTRFVRGDYGRGLIIVEITFRGPDVPPESKVLFRRGSRQLESMALDYVDKHRWTCWRKGNPAFKTVQVFQFRAPDEPESTPVKGSLQQFLAAIDKVTEQKVRFDFTTMGCPFKFRLQYLRPFTSNEVAEVGGPNPSRREFVDWLREVNFKPEINPNDKLVDSDFEVSVPCLVLDLL